MKKLERMRKMKEKQKQDDIEYMKQGAADAGLGFVEYELPPDDVEEKEVQRTLWTSLKSFIPYTNEWYEAMAAEEEMDNLKKIRIERVKAEDLLTMTKMGRHEEALESMMAETNYDFFYFNKLKMKMEAEGKFQFTVPTNNNMFAEFDKSGNRNRLKKAINQVNTFMDDKTTQELTRLASVEASRSKKFSNDEPCVWRGKNKEGENLKCDNGRMRKPAKKLKDGDLVQRKKDANEGENFYQCCAYHIPFCCSGNHEHGENVKIKQPNAEGFCSECYMLKLKRKPPQLTAEVCPGVVPILILGGTRAKQVKSAIDEDENDLKEGGGGGKNAKKRNPLQCQWQPNPSNEKMRGFECGNERAIDMDNNNQRLPMCMWHLLKCIRVHPAGSNPLITVPNCYGLCSMHYLSEYTCHPPETPFPYPGMIQRQAKDFWKNLPRHFAVPRAAPSQDILCRDYAPPPDPESVQEFFKRAARFAAYQKRYFLFSQPAAIRIQSTFRMYRVKNAHYLLKDTKMTKLRFEAAVTIQTQMRRFLQTRYMKEKRRLYNFSCTQIQRRFRGWSCRRELRRQWASRRITKFMKRLHFLKFRDTVIMVMQLRRLFLRRGTSATFVQRIYRGYAGRMFVFNKRLYNLVSRISTRKIQRWYRFHHERIHRKPWTSPPDSWAVEQCAKKLSRLILELYLNSKRRKELLMKMDQSAPQVQRLIRGFLAKQGKKKLSYLRKALRSWMKPTFALDFMEEFLKNRYMEVYFKKKLYLKDDVRDALPHQSLFLRSFLKPEQQNGTEIDRVTFESLLDQWYTSINLPLMSSEKEAIMKRFRNPVNGFMLLQKFDHYVEHHPQPCRKHGRRICGTCYYYKDCNILNCACREYHKNPHHRNGICTNCSHPMNLHAIAPLQLRTITSYTGENKMALLDLLSFQSEADMSLPVHAQGVSIESVLIPLIDQDVIREERARRMNEMRMTIQKQSKHLEDTNLIHGLATNLVEGNTVFDQNQYWKQYSTSSVEPHKTFRPSKENGDDFSSSSVTLMDMNSTVYEKVAFNACLPSTEGINYETFWDIVQKNPNKTVGDYHEKFDHNIPVPIINHGELVYTFEGPLIYYNIINQLITMEEYIHYDNPIFLKLVMDHIQIFERHWRKMVADLRTGTLDSKLPISKESRLIFESSNIPRPHLAKKLDNTFRDLGFHKKVLGRDIVIKPYAEKKKDIQREVSPPKRKRSLPFAPSMESILSMSRVPTRVGLANTAKTTDHLILSPPGTTSMAASNIFSREGPRKLQTTGLDRGGLTSPSKNTKRTGTSDFRPNSASGPSKRELLKTLGEAFKERKPLLAAIENNPQRPLTSLNHALEQFSTTNGAAAAPAKRRHSQSETQRPVSQEEVRSAGYALVTAPRDKKHYLEVTDLNEDRYVCPFPACGVTFLSKDAAIRHMITHEQKTRLSASTPSSDAHLRFYWPKDVPWLATKKYTEKKLVTEAFIFIFELLFLILSSLLLVSFFFFFSPLVLCVVLIRVVLKSSPLI
jgi:hypothetical protein